MINLTQCKESVLQWPCSIFYIQDKMKEKHRKRERERGRQWFWEVSAAYRDSFQQSGYTPVSQAKLFMPVCSRQLQMLSYTQWSDNTVIFHKRTVNKQRMKNKHRGIQSYTHGEVAILMCERSVRDSVGTENDHPDATTAYFAQCQSKEHTLPLVNRCLVHIKLVSIT